MLAWVLVAALVLHSQGAPLDESAISGNPVNGKLLETSFKSSSPCGTWTPYGEGKCVHFVDGSFETEQDAERVCRGLVPHLETELKPRLVTVKTKEEQTFLQNFVFTNDRILDSVWLGLKANANKTAFEWNDGIQLDYTNLGGQAVPDGKYGCVHMAAGDDIHETGRWYRTSCTKRSSVVCEIRQMKNQLFDTNLYVEQTMQPLEDGEEGTDSDSETLATGDETASTNAIKEPPTTAQPPTTPQPESPCDQGWFEYGDGKCVKLIDDFFGTNEQAKNKCGILSTESRVAKLITIRSKEDQYFIENYVFNESALEEGIWLGLRPNKANTLFEWNDDSPLVYENWGGKTVPDPKYGCVKMEAGDDDHQTGKWYRTSCKKTGAVVCEKPKTWSETLLQEELKNLKSKVLQLEKNTVPINSIYIQLPRDAPPSALWPQMTWKNISADYAGLFFRVEGGEAAPFGEIQNDTTRHLVEVQASTNVKNKWDAPSMIKKGWSEPVFSGSNAGQQIGLKFRLSDAEVRPRNQAVVVWKRVA